MGREGLASGRLWAISLHRTHRCAPVLSATPVDDSNLEYVMSWAYSSTVRRTLLLLISTCFLGILHLQGSGQTAPSECQLPVRRFLKVPDERGLAAVDQSGCWHVISSSSGNLNRLNELVAAGSRWAAEYSAQHLKELDGGDLEDALRALGQFSDHDMEDLLTFANRGLLSKHELADVLTMLPLTLTDRPPAQLSYLQARRHRVLRVNRADLQEQRAHALVAIDQFLAEIRSNQ
jgi:hypothetical protein